MGKSEEARRPSEPEQWVHDSRKMIELYREYNARVDEYNRQAWRRWEKGASLILFPRIGEELDPLFHRRFEEPDE